MFEFVKELDKYDNEDAMTYVKTRHMFYTLDCSLKKGDVNSCFYAIVVGSMIPENMLYLDVILGGNKDKINIHDSIMALELERNAVSESKLFKFFMDILIPVGGFNEEILKIFEKSSKHY